MGLPYFPMYPTDFEGKTSHLTLVEDGAYNRLLRICWMTPGCDMPADEAWVMRRARARTDEEIDAVRAVLSEFFTVIDGRFSNAKLKRIFAETDEAHKKRVSAGSKGGKAKSLNSNKLKPSNAKAKPKQPEPEPEPDTLPKGSDGQAVDFQKAIFENGVAYLCQHDVDPKKARSLIGKWRKDHDAETVFKAFAAANREGVTDPVGWMTKFLQPVAATDLGDMFQKAQETIQ